MNPFSLMRQQRFGPFFWTQGLGAFNDNVFKTALITQVAFNTASLTALDGAMLATLLPGLFILPFFLFSASAGQLADKYEKSQIIRLVKLLEICIMLFASIGFLSRSLLMLALALFLMGVHSTLFGPVKYSYLPQHLQPQELTAGNGLIEMGSFVAILLGQVLGAWLGSLEQHALFTSLSVLLIAISGYHLSRGVPLSPAADPSIRINWNPITETIKNVRLFWAQQTLWVAIVAISWFWFFGATLLAQFPNLAKQVLQGSERDFISLLSTFSLGVGIGSLWCEKLTKGKPALGLVMLGAVGMSVFTWDFAYTVSNLQQQLLMQPSLTLHTLAGLGYWRMLVDVALLGVCGGVYIVPLYVLLQSRAEAGYQSRVIAANNIMNALFMVVSAGFSLWLFGMGATIAELFAITAAVNLLVALYLCLRQPEYWQSTRDFLKQ
ncbi:MFS transporter [Methylophilus medardicus]|uniref:MFS transporter n=1 Tax=Methylophilus medardicus TaxID=2588534 RepID=A0A5B8CPC6_9PROT|nr:MFS transporter [Methylophilus medardicus]QDC43098.1 MFS transporter [Methylophilus medardicus]QDC48105.1 MFS transporter [Methylophilus medardicus]QDC51810.1 MFS transporter [Methylophilus medardicus]